MATTVSGVCTSSSSTFKPEHLVGRTTTATSLTPSLRSLRNDSVFSLNRLKLGVRSSDRNLNPKPPKSVAREVQASLTKNEIVQEQIKGLEKDVIALWNRYVEWLYQHKELGLFLDVSWIGFTDKFFEQMEPKLQAAFKAMQELEKGAIANPDEGRMVVHYWLQNSMLSLF